MWLIYITVIVLLYILYLWTKATRSMNKIVLVEKDETKPKRLQSLGNPLLGFLRMIYQTTVLKLTDFERMKQLYDLDPPLKCGTAYFFGTAFVITWNSEWATEVFVKPNTEVWGKVRNGFSGLFKDLTGESIVSVDGGQWKKQRAIMKPTFQYGNLKSLMPGFHNISQELCSHLDGFLEDGKFEPHFWMSRTTLDALGKCGFGMDFDALNGKMSEIYCAYEGIISAIANPLLLFKFYAKLPLKSNRKLHESKENFWKWARITVNNQLKEMENNPDRESNLMDMMIEAHFAENPQLNDKELLQNIFLFFLAGHETTSGTLTFVLDFLARHHDIQTKCREEIQSLFEMGEIPSYEKVKQLHYLNRVISESMRMRPIVNGISRQAKQDTTVQGYFIPKDTIINTVISSLQYDPNIWENPNEFNPDRWIEPHKSHSTPHFMPFGAGPRICLGMNFANLEMRVVLINLLLRYKFDKYEDLAYERSITLRPKEGYCLKISKL